MELFCLGLSAGVALAALIWAEKRFASSMTDKKSVKAERAELGDFFAGDAEIEAIMNYNGDEKK